jgi:hypothetical protein
VTQTYFPVTPELNLSITPCDRRSHGSTPAPPIIQYICRSRETHRPARATRARTSRTMPAPTRPTPTTAEVKIKQPSCPRHRVESRRSHRLSGLSDRTLVQGDERTPMIGGVGDGLASRSFQRFTQEVEPQDVNPPRSFSQISASIPEYTHFLRIPLKRLRSVSESRHLRMPASNCESAWDPFFVQSGPPRFGTASGPERRGSTVMMNAPAVKLPQLSRVSRST